MCLADRRWLIAPLVGAVALAAAMLLRAPLVERLAIVIDPAWLDLLMARNNYLFPHLWEATSFALPAVQAITILTAAATCAPPLRRLLLAALVSGAIGLLAAFVFGLFDPVLLVIQAQTWRMWWLTGVMAATSLGLCAIGMGRGDGTQRTALAFLVLGWILISQFAPAAVVLAATAFVLVVRSKQTPGAVSDRVANYVWAIGGAAMVAMFVKDLWSIRELGEMFQPGYYPSTTQIALTFLNEPILLGVIALTAVGVPAAWSRAPRAVVAAGAAVSVLVGAVAWRDAASDDLANDREGRSASLEALAPNKSGEVLWLTGLLQPWQFLGRPHWASDIQGAGIVFSRELAMTYEEREKFLLGLGLVDDVVIHRFPFRPKDLHPKIKPSSIAAVCSRPDAPAYVITPVVGDNVSDPALKAKIWTAPGPRVETLMMKDRLTFIRLERFAVIDCAEHRQN
jgi:hypothetical protein